MSELTGKHVLITGGTRGIGFRTAALFYENGSRVSIVGRHKDTVHRAISLITEGSKLPIYGTCQDLSTPEGVGKAYQRVKKAFGPVSILVNCVGVVGKTGAIQGITIEEWDRVLATNLTSFFLFSQLASRDMYRPGWGRIVNVSSIAGRTCSRLCGSHYSVSKAGVIALTRQLAVELGPFGINTNCICPGQTNTDMLQPFLVDGGLKKIVDRIPLGRVAEPVEQARVILFLATDAASYINGAIIDVTGGQL